MKWIEWARELQAISQTGLHYATDQFDRERYGRIEAISSEILASHTNLSADEFLKLNAAELVMPPLKLMCAGLSLKIQKFC